MNSVRFILLICSLFLLVNCEDKEKTAPSKVESVKAKVVEVKISEEKKDSLTKTAVPAYPKITNENVVEFLTDYGKENTETKVKITTRMGSFTMELFEETPLHRANFVFLVKQKYFENTFFHRVAPGFIIQGGNSDLRSTPKKRAAIGKGYRLPAEISTSRTHQYGSVCGAKEYRANPDRLSAPFEFYIFIGQPRQARHLNGDYTVFGRVTQGMDVVEKIANLPADEGEWPKQNVYISAELLD